MKKAFPTGSRVVHRGKNDPMWERLTKRKVKFKPIGGDKGTVLKGAGVYVGVASKPVCYENLVKWDRTGTESWISSNILNASNE